MSKKSSWVQIILFTAFISVFMLFFIFFPDKSFSEQENRELQKFPDFSFQDLFSGKFISSFESYTTDQFAFRDSWITIKAGCELMTGKEENKGVFLCKDDTLIESYTKPDDKQLQTNISAVKTLADSADIPVFFALVPGAAEIHSDYLPKNAPNYSQKNVIDYCYENSGAINIDILSAMQEHSDEYIYYRTDHHWTSLGAFYGYQALADAMGFTASPLSSYSRKTVTDEFYGTVYSKSGMTWVKPDSIEVFADQDAATQVFNYSSGEPVQSAMYNYDYLSKKDKYSMFMGGISPLITVSTGNTDAPTLLVLRDSYMDSLTPFLQSSFSKIYLMDLRYYKTQLMQSSIHDFISENGIDEVLVCYSVSNFGTDTNVFLLGE